MQSSMVLERQRYVTMHQLSDPLITISDPSYTITAHAAPDRSLWIISIHSQGMAITSVAQGLGWLGGSRFSVIYGVFPELQAVTIDGDALPQTRIAQAQYFLTVSAPKALHVAVTTQHTTQSFHLPARYPL